MSKWKIISKNLNWFIGCSAQMIFKKTEKNIFARSCQNKFEKNANSSYLNVWTSVRFLKAPIYSKGWWKIVGETLNNNALSSQWINQYMYTLFQTIEHSPGGVCCNRQIRISIAPNNKLQWFVFEIKWSIFALCVRKI